MKPKVSFIVLNWHHEAETLECVQSISELRGKFIPELIIVDNESSSNSLEVLSSIKDAIIIINHKNKGFAGGVNSGLAACTGDYIALVNNDCILDKNWMVKGLELIEQYNAGVIGGIEYSWNKDNPALRTKNEFHSLPMVDPDAGFTQTSKHWFPTGYTSNITGSNMLLRANLLKQLNGFDQDFFTYYEDSDLCARLLALNKTIVYSPDLKIWHKRNLSTNDAPFKKYYYSYRNQLIFVSKHFPDDTWLKLVLKSSIYNLLSGLYGRSGGFRTNTSSSVRRQKFTGTRRRALIIAGLWGLSHLLYLRHKRATNKNAKTFDSGYVEKLRVLQKST